jgi:hypothetical protein
VREKYCWLVADKPSEQAGVTMRRLSTCNLCKVAERFADAIQSGPRFDFLRT